MICMGDDFKVESYKSYKNKVFTKHTEKVTNQLRQIKDCSLHPDDKVKLKKRLIELINESLK
jgi:hypothetical protein